MIFQLSKTSADVVSEAVIRLYQAGDILRRKREAEKIEKKAGAFDLTMKAWKAYKVKKKFEQAEEEMKKNSIPQFISIQKERRRNRRPLRSTII